MLSDLPVVIFCGGRGARFDAETYDRPKPLITVAGKPMLRHIVEALYTQGFREFILPYGYLGNQIVGFKIDAWKEQWFPDATIIVEDTGENAHVGERLWKVRDIIGHRRFVMTYGDGLSDVQMEDVLALHTDVVPFNEDESFPQPLLTLTTVRPAGRFGSLSFWPYAHDGIVREFDEKPATTWINGGFMVVERRFVDSYLAPHPITGKVPQLEAEAMGECAADGFMRAHRHNGYWRCMDTRRDKEQIEEDVRVLGRLPWMTEEK